MALSPTKGSVAIAPDWVISLVAVLVTAEAPLPKSLLPTQVAALPSQPSKSVLSITAPSSAAKSSGKATAKDPILLLSFSAPEISKSEFPCRLYHS